MSMFVMFVLQLNLSFEDISCVEMPYLCLEIRKSDGSSVDFSLRGVPNGLSLSDCFQLDCRGENDFFYTIDIPGGGGGGVSQRS